MSLLTLLTRKPTGTVLLPPAFVSAVILADGVTLEVTFDQPITAGTLPSGFTRSVGTVTSGTIPGGVVSLVIPKVLQGEDAGTLSYSALTGTLAGDGGFVESFGPVAITNNSTQTWTPSALFDGNTGFVLDGSPGASAFYTTDGKVTLAATAGDPVGAITDTSGNGNDALQSVSGSRTTFNVDANGIRSFEIGLVPPWNLTQRWMAPATDVFTSTSMTQVAVFKRLSADGNGDSFLSNFDGGWVGGYHIFRTLETDTLQWMNGQDLTAAITTGPVVGGTGVAIARSAPDTVNGPPYRDINLTAYNLSGSLTATQQTLFGGSGATGRVVISANGIGQGANDVAFLMMIDKALSPEEQTNLLAYLVNKFSGWTP